MEFHCFIRLPVSGDLTADMERPPTQQIRTAIEREGGLVKSIHGTDVGWDLVCIFECQTPEAQTRITMTLKRAGFQAETRTLIAAAELDKAWANAVRRPVAATR